MVVFHVCKIVQMVPNRIKHHRCILIKTKNLLKIDCINHLCTNKMFDEPYKGSPPSYASNINPFSTNVPLVQKPGSWFLLAKCHRPVSLLKMSLFHRRFSNTFLVAQLPDLSVSGTLVENGLSEFKRVNFYSS